jgi:hypothetical protein
MSIENTVGEQAPSGSKLFYKQPELLNHEVHGSLGLRRPERPFEFARGAAALPLTLGELPTAQRYYPIIFASQEEPVPLAVVGAADDVNLFIDDRGYWEPGVYIPAYVRCYPLALAMRSDDHLAVVIDRAADAISDDPEQPFFNGDQVTAQTQSQIDFCGRYDAETKATLAFGERLKELGMLSGQQVSRTAADGTEERLASYIAVDTQKLNGLEPGVVKELFDNGYLASVFAHLFSLDNWTRLLERNSRRAGDAPR